jgi:PAS domain S-box-containing protein
MIPIAPKTTDPKIIGERERLWRQFEGAPGFICIQNGPDHVYQFANASYRALVGQRELIGKSVRDAMPDIQGQGFFERLDAVYLTGRRFRADAVVVRMARIPDGPLEERYVDLVYEPVVDDEGQVTGVFTQGHDVTEAVYAEERIQASEERFRIFA